MTIERLEELRAQIKAAQEEVRSIYKASLEAPEEDKVCEDFMAKMLAEDHSKYSIQWPTEIQGLNWDESCRICYNSEPKLVAIRPCSDEEGNLNEKTYLGIHLGSLATSAAGSLDKNTKVLSIRFGRHNPAILVPDLNKIVFGYESWWSTIESEEQLQDITDEDISNTWYVKLLKGTD